ncbi:MAG TPA: RNA 3'-terminal phosphate cyclase [Gammaproteobacteria bacterium]
MNTYHYINIDGSMGEGGGQVLRTALALSACLHQPLKIHHIRANRKKPGLMRQHLTAVLAAAKICGAEVSGAELDSQQIEFVPGKIQAGEYYFSIGTAGSTTLVLQTIILPLLFAEGASNVVIEGGTHNPLAPPFDFLHYSYLPLLERMGAKIHARLLRPGFFPVGDGCIEVQVEPIKKLHPISLLERGEILNREAHILLSQLPQHIGEREAKIIEQRLDWPAGGIAIEHVETARSPGNAVSIIISCEHITNVFAGIGQKGVKAETVANRVADDVRYYLAGDAPVDQHLADQLVLPMALAGGGEFVTTSPTLHTLTNIAVIEKFCEPRFKVEPVDKKKFRIRI